MFFSVGSCIVWQIKMHENIFVLKIYFLININAFSMCGKLIWLAASCVLLCLSILFSKHQYVKVYVYKSIFVEHTLSDLRNALNSS